MKPFRRCTRISILSLLLVSVLIPIFILSQRLKQFNSDDVSDEKRFVEDLSVLKRRTEAQKLNAIEEDEKEDVKEPKLLIYKDEGFKPVILLKPPVGNNISLFKQNGTTHEIKEKVHLTKDRKSSSVAKEKSLPSKSQLNQGVRPQLNQGVQPQSQRITNKVSEIKDQIIRAKVYLNLIPPTSHWAKELRTRIKDLERAVGDASKDSDLPKKAFQKMKAMEVTLSKAGRAHTDCSAMVKKLRAMTHNAEDQVRAQKDQTTFLTELTGRTTSRSIHCLSMMLTNEFFKLPLDKRELLNQDRVEDPDFFHFAVFSDNILASGVVVNSTVSAALDQEKIVFHVVTDYINKPAMSMWFLLNPPGKATIQVLSIDSFKWLASEYDVTFQKKYSLDSRFTSELNHLRFYLPEMFPSLKKIVFLDHDVVVQKDLTGLWGYDMKDKVNAAVETCDEGHPFSRKISRYINFTDPYVAQRFDPDSCTWAFGLNVFDLQAWRDRRLTRAYHTLLRLGNQRPVFKAGSLPIGWLTFYGETVALEREWHVLGLGYDSDVRPSDIEQGAVIHFDGVMKPWLDIGLQKYKKYWWKHVYSDHPFLQQCNVIGS